MKSDCKLKPGVAAIFLSAAGLLSSCGGGGVDGSSARAEGATGSLRPGIQGELMLGFMLPYSGTTSASYDVRERYLRLAVAEINAGGGVNGKTLGYMVRDTKAGTAEGAAAVAGEYLDLVNAGCFGIIGPLTSAEVLPLVPTVVKTGVPIITTGASSSALSSLDRGSPVMVYRIIASDAFSGQVAAQIARKEGKQTVALIYSDDTFGRSISASFGNSFVARGGQVIAKSAYPVGKTSGFADVVAKAFANGNPDAIYVGGLSAEIVGLSKDLALNNNRPRPALYGVSSLSNAQFVSTADASVIENMLIMGADSNPKRPEYLAFVDLYTKAYGVAPETGVSPSGYDAAYLFALAAQAGGSTAGASMAQWLGPVSRADTATPLKIIPGQFSVARNSPGQDWDYDGAKSGINWDSTGDVSTGSFIVYRVLRNSAGQLILTQVDQVTPD
ncbi:ABC transporter substrate-binding protein [Paucibacter sp. B2R-40]|uniref:ABC transporter substrate-binding protein n=1 Tax=Paucibacter sp. B2R-40 TaxID=2893554 RepID=UPI0021E3DC4D|nr:ABC transporter substrate-binding protein [Paucibacter sp. B2R-40]MCV2354425.1 ABC transporter substrate-binding protein [Paucibacter sp. B2R-40]